MGKPKNNITQEPDRDYVVVCWNGFNQEYQGAEGGGDVPARYEFTEQEALSVCRSQVKRGAIRAEVWRPLPEPVKIAAFERASTGNCRQTFPRK